MKFTKRFLVIAVAVCLFQLASAQNNYTTHILKQGESLSMLAKQYNTSVGDIMRLNGMHADTKLVYGAAIKIPSAKKQTEVAKKSSTTIMKTATATAPSNEITHIVARGETLYSISKKYNVTVEQLKSWNHLGDGSAKLGTLLIISDKGNNKLAATQTQKQRVETVASTEEKKQPVTENVKEQPAQTASPENKNIETQPALPVQNNTTVSVADAAVTNYSGNGYFASQFAERKNRDRQNISGISKTFKTASGWTDGKFYILANDIQPGTIVKITADNGNSVYAKVLWNMGDLKENAGINFRVSDATAAALHEDEPSFNVSVSF